MKTKNSRTQRRKSRKPSRKQKRNASDTAAQIIRAEDSPEALEAYAAILNPQPTATPQEIPVTIIHNVPRPDYRTPEQKRDAMLSSQAYRKRKHLSESHIQADRLSHTAQLAMDAPPETISADGVTGSAEQLLKALDALYNHATRVADSFGVQTRDVTAKLHAMACGGR